MRHPPVGHSTRATWQQTHVKSFFYAELASNFETDSQWYSGIMILVLLKYTSRICIPLHSAVSAPAARPLHRIQYPSGPVFHQVRHVADRVSMRQQVPAPRAVPVIIKPRPENEVRCDAEEDAALLARVPQYSASPCTYMMTSHVKKPQCAPVSTSSPLPSSRVDSHAYLVRHVNRSTSLSPFSLP